MSWPEGPTPHAKACEHYLRLRQASEVAMITSNPRTTRLSGYRPQCIWPDDFAPHTEIPVQEDQLHLRDAFERLIWRSRQHFSCLHFTLQPCRHKPKYWMTYQQLRFALILHQHAGQTLAEQG